MKMKVWSLTFLGVLAVGSTTAFGQLPSQESPYVGREILTEEQRSDALSQLKNTRDQWQEKIQNIEDSLLSRRLNNDMLILYRDMHENLLFDDQAYRLSYIDQRFPQVGDYANLQAFLDAYLANIVAWQFVPEAQRFWVTPPFSFPFDIHMRYTDVVMDNGEMKPLPELARGLRSNTEFQYYNEEFQFLDERSLDDPKPATLLAESQATMPEDFIEFEFDASDVGKTLEHRGYAITPRRFTEFTYDVEIQVPENQALPLRDIDIVGEAIAVGGRHIYMRSETHLNADYFSQKAAWLDDTIERAVQGTVELTDITAEIRALNECLSVAEGTTLHKAFAFNGSIEKARVTLLPQAAQDSTTSRSLEIPVYSRPVGDSDMTMLSDAVLEGPVFHHWTQARTDLSAEEMQQQILIGYSTFDLERPDVDYAESVYLNYPEVQSQLFVSPDERYDYSSDAAAQSVQFYNDKGGPIEMPDGDNVFAFTEHGLVYNPQYFSVWPARVTATLPILTAPNIIKRHYSLDELPEGIRLDGNRLTVDYEVFTPEEMLNREKFRTSNLNYFFAMDSAQRYLKQVGSVIEISREDREPIHAFYFYGRPESIELWYRGETRYVDYAVDVELRDSPLSE
ncbi:hypothetical protein [Vreelandella songnenensis]|nr:hypothetical protein [Halomonas songnenensis]